MEVVGEVLGGGVGWRSGRGGGVGGGGVGGVGQSINK